MEYYLIRDEYNQYWKIWPQDEELYAYIKGRVEAGEWANDIVIPMADIIKHRGWGWWTVFNSLNQLMIELNIPAPKQSEIPHYDELDMPALGELLQRYGSYIAFLETRLGIASARAETYEQVYKSALALAVSRLENVEKGATEKSKEAAALNSSPDIRETKRLEIEETALVSAFKGLCNGYKAAYDAVSRIITLKQMEVTLATTGRHP